jgi:hypothetical protein
MGQTPIFSGATRGYIAIIEGSMDAGPTSAEIEQQLHRMLNSACFVEAPQQAKVFEFLVTRACSGQETTQKHIRAEFFPDPPYQPDSTIVRRTVNLIRERLNEYYGEPGNTDAVLIAMPQRKEKLQAGEAYKPTFGYNPRSPVESNYKTGVYFLSNLTNRSDLDTALGLFHMVLRERMFEHTAAAMNLAECLFIDAICQKERTAPPSPLRWVSFALEAQLGGTDSESQTFMWHGHRSAAFLAVMVRDNNPDMCLPEILLGAFHCCCFDWQGAQTHFEIALKSSPTITRDHPLYASFLLAVGRRDEALFLVKTRAAKNPESPTIQSIYALFLYVTRQFAEAEAVLANVIAGYHSRTWFAHMIYGCVCLATEPTDALKALKIAQKYFNDEIFAGLVIVALQATALAEYRTFSDEAEALEAVTPLISEMTEKFASLYSTKTHPLHLAIASMVYPERHESAIEFLEEACATGHPLTCWIHLWPVLDPLRDHPRFQALLAKLHFPT